ncbi:hypothetical protein N0V82_008340 [Gnomoniopsis sp. IMI 355080]|nr:hypothetical protein N0V82_008340 [Gnomoniopsis sp. IMI 355080]
MIASFTTMPALYCLRVASPVFRRLKLDATFWKDRLSKEMPWLRRYGIPDSTQMLNADGTLPTVNWARVYHHMLRQSKSFLDRIDYLYPGLINRRRIWARCEAILKYYFVKQKIMPKDVSSAYEDVKKTQPILQISWTYMEELGHDELSKIRGIIADDCFGGFAVLYKDAQIRSIGQIGRPFGNVKTLSIDGAGGERIIRIYYITNRGRQLIVGQPLLSRLHEKVQPPVRVHGQPPPNLFLAGFYGWWSPAALTLEMPKKSDWTWFDAMGVFLSPKLQSASIPADPSIEDDLKDDTEGYDWWEPEPPPPWTDQPG